MNIALTAPCCLVGVLSRSTAAQHIGFTVQDYQKWVQLGLLPAADPSTGGWTKESLDKALDVLRREGWAAHHDLPDIQRQPRTDTVGIKKYHHYRRGVPGPLEGEPGSGVYLASLIEKNRQLACQQAIGETAPPTASEDADKSNPTRAEQQHKPSEITSDVVLQMGGAAPSDHQLPLYPEEWQIAVAVLGVQRASEWPSLAARLEREGLPTIDPLMGARFWPAVQQFFEKRHGRDGALAAKKAASSPEHRTRISLHNPQPVMQIETPNAAHHHSILLTAEELATRWRGAVSPETLKNHRSQRMGVPYVKIGRQPLYRLSDVERFEQQQLSPKPKP